MCENVLKIKPPLVFSHEDADQMITAVDNACRELLSSLASVDAENSKCMEATAPGRAQAALYIDKLFQDYRTPLCNTES
jgi:hypothetical protein